MAVLPFYLVMTLGLPLIGLVLLVIAGADAYFRWRNRRTVTLRRPIGLALAGAGLIVFPTAYFFYVLSIA